MTDTIITRRRLKKLQDTNRIETERQNKKQRRIKREETNDSKGLQLGKEQEQKEK